MEGKLSRFEGVLSHNTINQYSFFSTKKRGLCVRFQRVKLGDQRTFSSETREGKTEGIKVASSLQAFESN